jgi:hypothetical protein
MSDIGSSQAFVPGCGVADWPAFAALRLQPPPNRMSYLPPSEARHKDLDVSVLLYPCKTVRNIWPASPQESALGRRLVPELLAALPRDVDLAMRAHEILAI